MTRSSNETLERIARRIPIPEPAYERLLRRRDRRRRSQRIAAGVVGIAVFVAGVWIVRDVASLDRTKAPVVPGGASTDPFISIRAQLTDEEADRILFTVRADHAQYWRMYTLDHFDGNSWVSTSREGSEGGLPVSVPGPLGQLGGTPPPGARTLDQTFEIDREVPGGNALPMAQTPLEITESSFSDVIWDPARGTAFVDGGLEHGMTYSVRSRIVIPSAKQLDPLQFNAAAEYGQWTQLPADLDPRFTEIAQQWTAGEISDYRKVLAIQRHFHNGSFVYSTDVEPADEADALLEFLTRTKAGFCQHYASAMAVLVRALGLPARIAVGYGPGTLQDNGTYLVSTKDANAWVEVLFPTYGWLPFEPTPGHGAPPNALPGSYLNPEGASSSASG